MRSVTVVIAILVSLAVFGLVTGGALEWSGVAVIETRAADGTLRSTHVWFAEPDGELWLEAGTPDSPWLEDIQHDPTLSFSAARRSGQYAAHPLVGPSGHEKIRSLLRQKYGVRDWWVGLLVDTSGSVAVRLSSVKPQ
jgi:hypothetical protein